MTQIQQHFALVTYDNYINPLHPMYNYTTPLVLTCFSLTPMQCREYTIPINNVTLNHFHCLGSICIIPFSLPSL